MSNQHAGLIQIPTNQRSHPSHLSLPVTWTIDPSGSSVSLAWGKHRRWTITGRRHCFGIIHLDELPPVGVVQFEQPSGLPVLTIALDPVSLGIRDSDLDAMFGALAVVDVGRHRWWTLRSRSLKVLSIGVWRVMATFTANGTAGLVELHLEVHPRTSAEWLVLRGHGVLDRRAYGIGGPASTLTPQIGVDLAVRARRVEGPHPYREEG
jgi:polyisoprenoid-binding protein YceI